MLCWTDANCHTFSTPSTSPASLLAVVLFRKLVYPPAPSCSPISHPRKEQDMRPLLWHYLYRFSLCMIWFIWDKVQGVWSLGNRPFSSTSNRGVSSLASLPMLSVSKSSTPTVSPFNTPSPSSPSDSWSLKNLLSHCHGYCPHLPVSHWSFSYCHYWWNFKNFPSLISYRGLCSNFQPCELQRWNRFLPGFCFSLSAQLYAYCKSPLLWSIDQLSKWH